MSEKNIPKEPLCYNSKPEIIGLFAFGATTLLLSLRNAHILPTESASYAAIFAAALFIGGTAQIIAGIFCFILGRVFPTTAFILYGCFWLSYVIVVAVTDFFPETVIITDNNDLAAYGAYLFIFGFITLFLLGGTFFLHLNLMLKLLFAFLTSTFFILATADVLLYYGHNDTFTVFQYIGGVLGIITGLIALYIGLADLITILPLGAERKKDIQENQQNSQEENKEINIVV